MSIIEIEYLSFSQNKAKQIANKCAQLLNTLEEECLPGTELQSKVDEVTVYVFEYHVFKSCVDLSWTSVFERILGRVRKWSHYNLVKSFGKGSG